MEGGAAQVNAPAIPGRPPGGSSVERPVDLRVNRAAPPLSRGAKVVNGTGRGGQEGRGKGIGGGETVIQGGFRGQDPGGSG